MKSSKKIEMKVNIPVDNTEIRGLGLKFLIDQSILMYNANTKSHQNPYTLHYRAYSTKIRNHKHVVNKGIFTDNS